MNYQTVKTTLLVLAVLVVSLLWAVKPAQAMRRESGPALQSDLIIQPADLVEALDLSLAYGDGRKVNWQVVGF